MAKRIRKRRTRQAPVKGTRVVKLRNPYAAQHRSGSGTHPNRRKAQNKRACRGRVDY